MEVTRHLINGSIEKEYTFTKEEIQILYSWLKNEFLPPNDEIIAVMKKISSIANKE